MPIRLPVLFSIQLLLVESREDLSVATTIAIAVGEYVFFSYFYY